ncbi:MAG: cytochrome b [Pseudomonadota bacterium]
MTETERYTSVAKAFHWAIAILIISEIAGGIIMTAMPFSDTKFLIYQFHKSFGLTVLMLSLGRLAWRLTHKPPAPVEGIPTWQERCASAAHVAFYVVMIGIPLSGWLMVSASTTGIPTKLFFVIPVPHWPIPVSESSELFWESTHEIIAKSTIGLIVLHVAAALKHHFKDRDLTLVRMLPEPFASRWRPTSVGSQPSQETPS